MDDFNNDEDGGAAYKDEEEGEYNPKDDDITSSPREDPLGDSDYYEEDPDGRYT